MPGQMVRIDVAEGDIVEAGQTLAIVEAMKMENVLKAEKRARVSKVRVKPGAGAGGGRGDLGVRGGMSSSAPHPRRYAPPFPCGARGRRLTMRPLRPLAMQGERVPSRSEAG